MKKDRIDPFLIPAPLDLTDGPFPRLDRATVPVIRSVREVTQTGVYHNVDGRCFEAWEVDPLRQEHRLVSIITEDVIEYACFDVWGWWLDKGCVRRVLWTSTLPGQFDAVASPPGIKVAPEIRRGYTGDFLFGRPILPADEP